MYKYHCFSSDALETSPQTESPSACVTQELELPPPSSPPLLLRRHQAAPALIVRKKSRVQRSNSDPVLMDLAAKGSPPLALIINV